MLNHFQLQVTKYILTHHTVSLTHPKIAFLNNIRLTTLDKGGNAVSLGMSIVVVFISFVLRWYLGHLNDVKLLSESSESRQQSLEDIGDLHPGTSYIYIKDQNIYNLLTQAPGFFYTI